MNNITKFASLWMKFGKTGSQATDSPLPVLKPPSIRIRHLRYMSRTEACFYSLTHQKPASWKKIGDAGKMVEDVHAQQTQTKNLNVEGLNVKFCLNSWKRKKEKMDA